MATRNSFGGDRLFLGRARNPFYESGFNGIEQFHLMFDDFGAIVTAAASGLVGGATATAAGAVTMNGVLATTGVGVFDVGRAPTVTATGDVSGATFTFTGTDDMGRTVKQSLVGPTGALTVTAQVGMKTITAISSSAGWATTNAITIGSGNVFNFKFRMADKGKVSSISQDGKPESTLTLVAALASSVTPTATTADARGTWAPNTAPDSTKRWNALYRVDHSDDTAAFGVTPFSG